ncbi:hypothetical protein DUNSADRAFT_9150 [Dunaliella salina]|uniref:Encoded protein n=1 Tax=Dunaliella salina TaxID=3046 RepID=A0ABQ7GI59_DUNSA|nr:hypothetical protein DUNSADRAFT_9150 [Dunaliella salina]|eukprot:KAF5834283.1 hypothetical protein DUNSADRAFT_9150 [Dunaliella salina]
MRAVVHCEESPCMGPARGAASKVVLQAAGARAWDTMSHCLHTSTPLNPSFLASMEKDENGNPQQSFSGNISITSEVARSQQAPSHYLVGFFFLFFFQRIC